MWIGITRKRIKRRIFPHISHLLGVLVPRNIPNLYLPIKWCTLQSFLFFANWVTLGSANDSKNNSQAKNAKVKTYQCHLWFVRMFQLETLPLESECTDSIFCAIEASTERIIYWISPFIDANNCATKFKALFYCEHCPLQR